MYAYTSRCLVCQYCQPHTPSLFSAEEEAITSILLIRQRLKYTSATCTRRKIWLRVLWEGIMHLIWHFPTLWNYPTFVLFFSKLFTYIWQQKVSVKRIWQTWAHINNDLVKHTVCRLPVTCIGPCPPPEIIKSHCRAWTQERLGFNLIIDLQAFAVASADHCLPTRVWTFWGIAWKIFCVNQFWGGKH